MRQVIGYTDFYRRASRGLAKMGEGFSHFAGVSLLTIACASCTAQDNTPPSAQQPSIEVIQSNTSARRLKAIVDDYEALTPSQQTNVISGWTDNSPAATEKRKKTLKALHARLKALSNETLKGNDILTHKILLWQLQMDIELSDFDVERMPFIAGDGFFTEPNYAADVTKIASPDDAEAWLQRLAELPAFYDQAVANLRRGLADGFVQTRPTTKSALEMMETAAALSVLNDPLVKVFSKARPASIGEADWNMYHRRAETVVLEKVRPAQKRAIDFFKNDYLPNARPSLGAATLPDGKAYYAYLVRRNTSTDMTPDEVFELGQSEVKRIRREMEAAITETGFKGSFQEFLTFLRTDPQFFPQDAQDAVEKASEIAKRADYILPQYFEKLPRLPYGIRIKPPELEGTSGAYFLGDPKRGISGSIMMGRNSQKTTLYDLPAWILHEGVPGHHLQIALGQERFDLPAFRRRDSITAYVEGWALYSEKLGVEMGIYRTPYEDFGRMSFEIWRACRLVMDVGIHWKGWSFEQAAKCLKENTALPLQGVEGETYRYIGWPGQALGYKVGELEILANRKRAEEALGTDFDIRAFHTMITDFGPMPMAVLKDHTDAWIASQKSKVSQ